MDSLDVIIVTGDAYVDHPSYGASVIGRVLEDAGFRVGIIAQPDWRSASDFMRLGKPRLFFGVTAGNLDSMVANYTANKKVRNDDDYSPGGAAGLRPDRAVIVYANRVREAFKDVPIVLGGIEASLRRLAHYDYWSDKVRRSALVDAKADILVYGMGERAILEIAGRLKKGEDVKDLEWIRGTVIARSALNDIRDYIELPSFEEVSADKDGFNKAFRLIHSESDPYRGKTVVQRHGSRFVIQFPPTLPLKTEELDKIYLLDYAMGWHPAYDKKGGVPGYEAVRYSVISHRGCCGGCGFCSLYFHQGRIVQSRSAESIVEEARRMAKRGDFKGTITDVGGPTANLYMARCPMWEGKGACADRQCLIPARCGSLKLGYGDILPLLRRLKEIPKVRHVFIGSGLRYDLLTDKESDGFLAELCRDHVSGRLKVAPEHCVDKVLKLMNKPPFAIYEKFAERFAAVTSRLKKRLFLVNYIISGHPGSTLEDALESALYFAKRRTCPEQIQDYVPLPMTASAAMYHTGEDPFTGEKVYVAKGERERKLHRALMQYAQPKNKRYVLEALRRLRRTELKEVFYP
jgi:uncharacterized radical SAM protein YgiQ